MCNIPTYDGKHLDLENFELIQGYMSLQFVLINMHLFFW
jgi:hypothetical protein